MTTPLLLLLAMSPAAEPVVAADLVLSGGKVWTGDPKQPEAQAVAVWRDRILKVGTDADVRPLVGPNTRVIDLAGRRVVPGFIDSHAHVLGGGMQLSRVELKDAKDEAEFGRRLREYAANTPRDRWILGGNWDHDRAFGGKLPTAAIVDKYVSDRPVFIRRYDGHMALANSVALKLANITEKTKDPTGGVIDRLPDGKPAGVLKDAAMGLVDRLVPPPSEGEIAEAVRAALKVAAEVGVTSIQDMEGSGSDARRRYLRILQRLAKAGELTCRIDVRWPIALRNEIIDRGVLANFGSPYVRIGGVKGFMDGSLGSSTAKFFDGYADNPANKGVFVFASKESMQSRIRSADAGGLSVAVHAIGDEANAVLLDMFDAAAKANGSKDSRYRIEHAQHLRPQDYPRFKQLGVIASMQPYHAIDDGRWAEGRIGKERCRSSYAFRSLLDAGAVLAFGSDWPVAPLDPLPGIDAAVNRRTLDGKHPDGWFPEQRITVAEAVRAYGWGGAYAGFQEGEKGTVEAGKLADLVVLGRDIFDPKEKDRIGETKVELTIVGGKVVYERKN
ncbi:MAG TPA: amidohydrolase [Fimbriiglobus sp.]|nr:amidohydrolase [Fimbriiglobus sp.]